MSTLQESASISAALLKHEARRLALEETIGARNEARRVELEEAIGARNEAQQALATALRKFRDATQAEVTATAKDAAERGVPYQKFLQACIANARSNCATWSGGPQATPNVIEAITAHCWLEAAHDIHISFFFKEAQQ